MPFTPNHEAIGRTAGLCLERGWALVVRCTAPACGHTAELGEATLAALPPAASLESIGQRLKCSACGGQEGLINLRNGGWGALKGFGV